MLAFFVGLKKDTRLLGFERADALERKVFDPIFLVETTFPASSRENASRIRNLASSSHPGLSGFCVGKLFF